MPIIDLTNRDVDRWTLRTMAERGSLFLNGDCWRLTRMDVPALQNMGESNLHYWADNDQVPELMMRSTVPAS